MKTLPLILASQSLSRAKMLQGAGLDFSQFPANLDEESMTKLLRSNFAAGGVIAAKLAQVKALQISAQHKGALVIGADQVLTCGKEFLTKARDEKDALKKLKFLNGKTHELISAVCVAKDGKVLWRKTDMAKLKMRKHSPAFLKAYAASAGEGLTRAVGAYELEGAGAWLFEKVEGDFFTILGLPLLPLLRYLADEQGFKPT